MQTTKIQQIHFHGDFYSSILQHQKTQTARFGEDHLQTGKAEAIFDDYPPIAIEITKLTYKTIDELSQNEIEKDGFSSQTELWNVLLGFYPSLTKEDQLLLIEFKRIL